MSDTWLDGEEARRVLVRLLGDAWEHTSDECARIANRLLAAGVRIPKPVNPVIEQAARVLCETACDDVAVPCAQCLRDIRALDAAGLLVKEAP